MGEGGGEAPIETMVEEKGFIGDVMIVKEEMMVMWEEDVMLGRKKR